MGVGEFLGPLLDRRGEQQFAARRRPEPVLGRADAALVGDLEVADLLDRVAEELDPQRVFLGGREHVDDAAADGDLAAAADQVDPGVADLDQPGEQVVEFARLADLQRDRLEVAEAGHDRLQHAPDRRHHDRQRPVRLARPGRVGQPPQHGDPLSDGVQARRQPLMGQGLPAREVGHAVGREKGAERGGQVFGLPGRGRDREHEPRGAPGRAARQRGRQHRPQRRRRDEVLTGEGGFLAVRARAGRRRRARGPSRLPHARSRRAVGGRHRRW